MWNEAVIDSFPVITEWRGGIKAKEPSYPKQECLNSHVRVSQYFLPLLNVMTKSVSKRQHLHSMQFCSTGFFPAPHPIVNILGSEVSDIIDPGVNF